MWTSKRVPHMSHFSFQQTHSSHALLQDGMHEKCVVRRCRRGANTTGGANTKLDGRAHGSWAYTARHCTEQDTPSSARENDATRDATNTRCMRQLPV